MIQTFVTFLRNLGALFSTFAKQPCKPSLQMQKLNKHHLSKTQLPLPMKQFEKKNYDNYVFKNAINHTLKSILPFFLPSNLL